MHNKKGEVMHVLKTMSIFTCAVALISCGWLTAKFKNITSQKEFSFMLQTNITQPQDLSALFPKTVDQVTSYATWIIKHVEDELPKIFDIPDTNRTFKNSIEAFDALCAQFSQVADAISILEMVSPDQDLRDACQKEAIRLKEFAVDTFASKRVYHVFKSYVQTRSSDEVLSDEAQYSLKESMKSFHRQGFDLPDDQYQEIQTIRKELSKLATKFDTNIATDQRSITVPTHELEGIDQNVLSQLEKNEDGNVIVGCDYPTYFEVMGNCHHEQPRKKLYRAFNQRAYPANYELLSAIMKKRYELAGKLGFASYAALDIDSEMAKTPERVHEFLEQLIKKCEPKLNQEMAQLLAELPEGVSLNDQSKFNPWDFGYVKECYKKKHFQIDERKIAEYFTEEKTINGIFDIYQKFFNLEFKLLQPDWAWHADVKLIEVHDRQTGVLRGFIYLDLFPRPHKYSHACHAGLVSTTKQIDPETKQVTINPSVAVVIANFPKAANGRPALLKFSDVETFFHEFGHAMHALLGSTELVGNSGTAVKTDFVEMPSQMFENWLYEKEILQPLSSHYQTGEKLPDELLEKLIALKKFDSGNFVTRQCLLSRISLDLYDNNPDKDIDALVHELNRRYVKHVSDDPENHFCASFGHLTGYGAKYYSYMWSKVFAIDVFYALKELGGIQNTEAGRRFVEKVLGRGGSVDPNIMLQDFLGREPSQKAFIEDLGIH